MANWASALTRPPTFLAFTRPATGGIEFFNAMNGKVEECIAEGERHPALNTKADALTNDAAGAVNGVVANGVTYGAKSVISPPAATDTTRNGSSATTSRTPGPPPRHRHRFRLRPGRSPGASFSNMEYLPAYPGAVDTSEDTYGMTLSANTSGWSGAIWVDKNGGRMVDEVDFTVAARRQLAWKTRKTTTSISFSPRT